jgi:hypothetical protein
VKRSIRGTATIAGLAAFLAPLECEACKTDPGGEVDAVSNTERKEPVCARDRA